MSLIYHALIENPELKEVVIMTIRTDKFRASHD
jgi:hypothetical protein